MDDLGIDGDALAKPVVVLPQGLGGGFGVDGAGVQVLERGRDAVRLGLSADEFFFQVDVLVGEDPALDACLGGELQRGERAPVDRVGRPSSSRWIAAVMASRSVAIVGFSGAVVGGDDVLQAVELVLFACVSERGG
ncbi:hypothetical protein [Streptomyces roseicoloratus]|uniref:hypothetical protein n=1 Tax=Streptomyces roseicoloratus TaxID=2508722 RepID=UPI0015E160FB|nr:hypothetical protein [Streptomyces roseicoloratus]